MNMKKTALIIILLTGIILWACKKDFIVEDISNKTITVNSPANNLATTTNLITFWWEAVDGAEKYNLQVVKPSFASATSLILDTSISVTRFNLSLQPGSYQWRIKAFNAGHSTAFQVFTLRIDSTTNLAGLFVNQLSPVNGAVTGNSIVTFNWSPVISATKYRLQINGGAIKDTLLANTSLTYTLPAASNATTAYTWNVKAVNNTSESAFNTSSYTLTVDLKPPVSPSLVRPASGTVVSDTAKLVWSRNATDAVYDSVYIGDDSLFTNIYQQIWTDQQKLPLSDLSLSPNTGSTYFWWKVRSFDAVGNHSSFSGRFKFKLVP